MTLGAGVTYKSIYRRRVGKVFIIIEIGAC